MSRDLLIHPETYHTLQILLENPTHAVMLSGNEGSGKGHVARWLAEEILGPRLENHAYFKLIEPEDGKQLTIEQIRQLQNFTRLRTTGKQKIRRIVVIADAHKMTVEAQNALLKMLEEPPKDTMIIMTAVGDKTLKATIYSRVWKVRMRPISRQQAFEYASNVDSKIIERVYNLSGGDASLFISLLGDSEEHDLAVAITLGKKLLSGTTFERLARVDELSKNKDNLLHLLLAMKRIASAAMKQASDKKDAKLRIRWLKSLDLIYAAEQQLRSSNANAKLLLTDLFLSI